MAQPEQLASGRGITQAVSLPEIGNRVVAITPFLICRRAIEEGQGQDGAPLDRLGLIGNGSVIVPAIKVGIATG